MFDATSAELFMKAVGITGPAAVGTIVGAIVKSLLDGKTPRTKENTDAQDVRTALADFKRDQLDSQIEALRAQRDELRFSRNEARAQRNRGWERINAFEEKAGVPPSVWPADEPDRSGG